MTNQATFRNLRYVLATIYDDDITARRVVQDAGLDPLRIAFSARAIDNWQAILSEAHKTARLNALLEVALTEYANNQPLRDAYDNYRRAADQPDPLDPIVEASLAEDAPAPGEPPFKGLTYFGVDDASIFFGREQQVDQLVNHLRQARFLAVVGASGSGKSSLVRAGLVPAIQGGAYLASGESLPAGHVPWRVHLITPTNDPLEALADALTRDNSSVTLMDTIMADMVKQPRSLHRHVKRWLDEQQPASDGCLIMVDQFEELFTMCRDQARRQHFVDNLMTAVTTDGPTRVVLTLRADFYAHCAQFNDLREALAKNQIYIGPMTTDELHRAITEPARQQGWTFEPGLVDLLLTDVGHEPGALPLLSHALLETWRRRRGRMLTLAGYVGSGRVQGAIAQTAERVFIQNLTEAEQSIAKNIFLRLTELGEGTEDTRRRVKTTEFISSSDAQSVVEHVLKVLADARLLTIHKDEVEVAHEALIREWPTLRQWLDKDREALQIHRRLTEATEEWTQHKRDASFLYRGELVSAATQWADQYTTSMNAQEKEFLTASRADQRRRNLLQRSAIITILALLMVLSAIYMNGRAQVAQQYAKATQAAFSTAQQSTATAITQSQIQATVAAQATATEVTQIEKNLSNEANLRKAAERQSKIALSRQLAAQAISSVELNQDIELGLLLAVESARFSYDAKEHIDQAYEALHQAIDSAPMAIYRQQDGFIGAAAFSPDGSRLAISLLENAVGLIDSKSGEQLARLQHDEPITELIFSPNGSRLATASMDKTVRLWDSLSGKQLARFQHDANVGIIVFSPDGTRLFTIETEKSGTSYSTYGGFTFGQSEYHLRNGVMAFGPYGIRSSYGRIDGTIRLWDAIRGSQLLLLRQDANVNVLVFSPDSSRLIIGSMKNTVHLWNSINGEQLPPLPLDIDEIALSPDGSRLATLDRDNSVQIWDSVSRERLIRIQSDIDAKEIIFSFDGSYLAIRSADNWIQMWDSNSGKQLVLLQLGTDIVKIIFSPDGSRIATLSTSDMVILWDTINQKRLVHIQLQTETHKIVFSPDSSRIAIVSTSYGTDSGIAGLWDSISGKQVASLIEGDGVWDAVFSLDSSLLVTLSRRIQLWDSISGKQRALLQHNRAVQVPIFSPDNVHLATLSLDNMVRLWNSYTTNQPQLLQHEAGINAVAFSPDGTHIATGSTDKTVRLWDSFAGNQLAILQHEDPVLDLAFSPDGTRLATASSAIMSGISTIITWDSMSAKQLAVSQHEGGTSVIFSPARSQLATGSPNYVLDGRSLVRLWDSTSMKQLSIFQHEDFVRKTVFSSDGSRLATISNNIARLWSSRSGELLAVFQHEDTVIDIAFSSDDTRLATASNDDTARLWNSLNGELLAVFQHEANVNAISFSPNEFKLATASDDKTVRLWDATNKKQLLLLQHEDIVNDIAFSPDGSRLATASDDHTARLWHSISGEQLALLQHETAVKNVVFSSDGFHLATRSEDNTVRLWYRLWWLDMSELVNLACKIVSRDLTQKEWDSYFANTNIPYHSTCQDLPTFVY